MVSWDSWWSHGPLQPVHPCQVSQAWLQLLREHGENSLSALNEKKKKKQANNVTVNDLSNIWKIHYYFINNLLQSLVYSTYLHKAQENQDFPLL